MSRILSVIPARVFTLFAAEVILLYASYITAAYLDRDIDEVWLFLQYDSGFLRISIVIGIILFGLFVQNLYANLRIRRMIALIQSLCMTFGAAFIGQGLIGYVSLEWIIPRKMMLTGSVLAILLLFGCRLLFDRAARSADATARVLFLGVSPAVSKIADHLEAHPELGLKPMGYLENGAAGFPARFPRLGSIDDLDRILDESVPESIVICSHEDVKPWWAGEFLALRFGGVNVQEVGSLYEGLFTRKCVSEIRPSRLIFAGAVRGGSLEESLRSALSWAVALAFGIVALPVLLLLALLIRLGSAGPVLTREVRVGLKGALFTAYGFRSTAPNGEVTPVGRFLRRNGLVWLPQLLNVFKGEMAMVGPRPERPAFARRMNELIPYYQQRQSVKPGLTGWARIHRGPSQRQDSLTDLEYDLYYLENRSALLDIFILLLSLRSVEDFDFQGEVSGAPAVG